MPSKSFIVLIVAFWAATSAWLFHRDIWPQLRSEQPPPFGIDLADEARQHATATRWTVLRSQSRIGIVETWVKYRALDNTFEFYSKTERLDIVGLGSVRLRATDLQSMYRVSQEGVFRELFLHGKVRLEPFHLEADLHLYGQAKDGWFTPHGSVEVLGKATKLELEPVPVSPRASVITPLHPLNRIRGLRRGQHWRVPLVDPLADSLNGMIQKDPALQVLFKRTPGIPTLRAEVLPRTEQIEYWGKFYGCLIIEYRGDNVTAHTWVRESDGLVLKQDATLFGDHLTLERN
jgi:hypothetical protein